MRKGSRFLIGLAAAALSFGTLFATLGPEKFNQHRCGKDGCWEQQRCNNQGSEP